MEDPSTITTLLSNLQLVAYVKVAFLSLLIFDTVITLDQEYRYIWQRKWHLVKVLYLFTRYTTFVDTAVAAYERVDQNFVDCDRLMTFNTIFSGFGIGITELILMIRTYALYNSSRRILFSFIILWLAVGGVNFWAVTKWTGSYDAHIQTIPSGLGASMKCYLGRASALGLVCYLSLLAGETVIVLMTAVKAFKMWWDSHVDGLKSSRLITCFYRDGILFYFCILPFTIVNVIAVLGLPEGLLLIADTPLRVLHTILTCRLVLHVRRVADTARHDWEDAILEELKFKTMPEPEQIDRREASGSEHV
ncbi:hypothetical protein L218DRAFT_712131 [Marasmius fiardii PR-910]|nr:hypothetical protein L218DRAFT_712131 [Marasmius fiardii PR-910]